MVWPLRMITESTPMQNRARRRPKIRWREQVEDNIKTIKIEERKKQIADRKKWRKIADKAKTHKHER